MQVFKVKYVTYFNFPLTKCFSTLISSLFFVAWFLAISGGHDSTSFILPFLN